jgi:TetR/AcrR family transcriptional regulator, transcriptional repressor for nem operon
VDGPAGLMHDRGVAATTLEDVKAAAEVSGSQMYHYFTDKNELVQAVIDYQAGTIVKHNRQALGSPNGVEAWRKTMVTGVRSTQGKGGCPPGSLGGQLAENDPEARALGCGAAARTTTAARGFTGRRSRLQRRRVRLWT